MDPVLDRYRLGHSDLQLTPIGLGCWQFSQRQNVSGMFWPTLGQETIEAIVRVSLEGGINWFDTAEVYGWGRSEQTLAGALRAADQRPGSVRIATKWWPSFRGSSSITETIEDRLAHLGGFPIDLHQVHHPLALASTAGQMRAMAGLVQQGKIRAVGVSNFSAAKMLRAHQALRAVGLGLSSNQVKYSLLDRRIEVNGVLQAAKQHGITIIAYSPLEQGLLSGKFHDNPELVKGRGFRKLMPAFKRDRIQQSQPLIDALRHIARTHEATPTQVALNWLVTFHGPTVVAIPGATKLRHAEENVRAMSFRLSPEELTRLDETSRPFARLD